MTPGLICLTPGETIALLPNSGMAAPSLEALLREMDGSVVPLRMSKQSFVDIQSQTGVWDRENTWRDGR